MSWKPTFKQCQFLQAIQAMTTDSMRQRGVDTMKDFTENLRTYADLIEKAAGKAKP